VNRELKADWVQALRSGEYAQTKGTLNRVSPGTYFVDSDTTNVEEAPIGFCCLGVLCDRLAKKFPATFSWGETAADGTREFNGIAQYRWTEDTDTRSYLPEPVLCIESLGFMARVDGLDIDTEAGELAESNDEGAGFTVIADWIEENIEEDDTPLPF
jgi:hypothetical protein